MPEIAVRVEELSKLYRIGLKEQIHETLAGAAMGFFRAPFKNFRRLRDLTDISTDDVNSEDVVWALRDVSFEVKEGEILGIIGVNGAGKSTLLKILAGITEPTFGRAYVRGRVASLLEVGTGFHPDLTGRENVYLNGTILGMTKEEIDVKFDEIVAFSGVEKFIDTPVKRFSSGMRVRLAFAVAAHLECQVLFVDEVLAVGDAAFQRKCIDKMKGLSQSGRTILFVSHNLAAVNRLCTTGILLANGEVSTRGATAEVVRRYGAMSDNEDARVESVESSFNVNGVTVEGPAPGTIQNDSEFSLTFRLTLPEPMTSMSVRISIRNAEDQLVVHCRLDDTEVLSPTAAGIYRLRVRFPVLWMTPGQYGVQVKGIAESTGGRGYRTVSAPAIVHVSSLGIERFELPGVITPKPMWDIEFQEI